MTAMFECLPFCGWRTALPLVILLLCGCSNSPPSLYPPEISPDAAAAAIGQYDANSDGELSDEELAKSPGLRKSLSRIDRNKNGHIDAEELNRRFEAWQEAKLGLLTLLVSVRMDGQLLPGADVTLTPEKFLGPAVQFARGTTGKRGTASVQISNQPNQAGVQVGFYSVRISKRVGDKEIIPARYNERTELGIEVAQDSSDILGAAFELKSN